MKPCKECGIGFEPKNPKGVFCSAACRQKDHRRKVAAELAGYRAAEPIVDLPGFFSKLPILLPSEVHAAVNKMQTETFAEIISTIKPVGPSNKVAGQVEVEMPADLDKAGKLRWIRSHK